MTIHTRYIMMAIAFLLNGMLVSPVFADHLPGDANGEGSAEVRIMLPGVFHEGDHENNQNENDHDREAKRVHRHESDTTAPVILGVMATQRSQTNVRIMWITNERADSRVWLSTVKPVDTTGAATKSSDHRVFFHNLRIKDLLAGTTYFFVVGSTDAAGNTAVSEMQSFTTEPTSTPDIKAPSIVSIRVSDITQTGARVRSTTDEAATEKVLVSKKNPVVESESMVFTATDAATNQSVEVTGLAPNTTYFFSIQATDVAGNMSAVATMSFTTEPADTTAPTVLGVTVIDRTQTSARILWATSERSDSNGWISSTASVDTAAAPRASSTGLDFFHQLALSNLTAGTKYFFVVGSTDAAGNLTKSDVQSFTTEPGDTTPPAILGVNAIRVTATSADIIWTTNESATSSVWASTTTPVATTGAATASNTDLGFFHALHLSGLTAGTIYHVVVGSTDAAGNASVSGEIMFTTAAQ